MKQFFTVILSLLLGFMIGVMIDKQWLTDQQQLYVQKLQVENDVLVHEKNAWLSYVEAEIGSMKLFTTAENEQYKHLHEIFEKVGLTIEKVPQSFNDMIQQQGIIVSVGEELRETYGLPQLMIEELPKQDADINVFYLSLLRLKGEHKK